MDFNINMTLQPFLKHTNFEMDIVPRFYWHLQGGGGDIDCLSVYHSVCNIFVSGWYFQGGIGHLLIFMRIKVLNDENNFTLFKYHLQDTLCNCILITIEWGFLPSISVEVSKEFYYVCNANKALIKIRSTICIKIVHNTCNFKFSSCLWLSLLLIYIVF